jgi:hypothetical protein
MTKMRSLSLSFDSLPTAPVSVVAEEVVVRSPTVPVSVQKAKLNGVDIYTASLKEVDKYSFHYLLFSSSIIRITSFNSSTLSFSSFTKKATTFL